MERHGYLLYRFFCLLQWFLVSLYLFNTQQWNFTEYPNSLDRCGISNAVFFMAVG